MGKRKGALIRIDVPRSAFELARERTHLLMGEIGFFYQRSRHIEPADALGDALACAYLQGTHDAATVIDKVKAGIKEGDGK